MATEALKSTAITNLDASPVTRLVPGVGGTAYLRHGDGSLTATTGQLSQSTYQLARIPTRAIIKQARVKLDAGVTTFTADCGFYYSTSTTDGTPAGNRGTQVSGTTGSHVLGTAVVLANQTTFLDLAQNLTAANLDKKVWDAIGLATDPGGYFDFVLTTTTTNSGAPVVYGEIAYVDPGS